MLKNRIAKRSMVASGSAAKYTSTEYQSMRNKARPDQHLTSTFSQKRLDITRESVASRRSSVPLMLSVEACHISHCCERSKQFVDQRIKVSSLRAREAGTSAVSAAPSVHKV
jgi:hypothetical protein